MVGAADAEVDSGCVEPNKRLFDPFSCEEEMAVEKSALAQQITELEGCNCAESVLLATLRYLEQPEEWLHSAAAFGSGMGQRDLCGLLTGSFMALGIAAGVRCDANIRRRQAKRATNEFWRWWETLAPRHCGELKPEYDGDGYQRMQKRVAVKLDELIETHMPSVCETETLDA